MIKLYIKYMEELVVLVDEQNLVLGTHPKATVHTNHTPLHRGFSCFLFDENDRFLVTQRAFSKKTFGGVWTNSVCGHPGVDEEPIEAVKRRLLEELGMTAESLVKVSDYRYTFADKSGIVENEICPIFMGVTKDKAPKDNKSEIEAWKWVAWEDFMSDIQKNPEVYSPWCREEALYVDVLRKNKTA
jgi:isopentenyl-diphosphate delta-isomerase